MLLNKTIAVVVPAYNEEDQIGMVIDSMPDFVDRIIVVNDCSPDRTAEVVKSYINKGNNTSLHSIKNILTGVFSENIYNRADKVLRDISRDEIKYYLPSEVVNKDPESERVI